MKSVVRIRYKNEKPKCPVWFDHRNGLHKVKNIVKWDDFKPDEIKIAELLKGIKFIDLVYNDESKYNYDIKFFYKRFSKLLQK